MIGERKGEQLDGYVWIGRAALDLAAVHGLEDAAHAAFADELNELEAPEQNSADVLLQRAGAGADLQVQEIFVEQLRRCSVGDARRRVMALIHYVNSLVKREPKVRGVSRE